jgi:flagellar protein FliO/FliZ
MFIRFLLLAMLAFGSTFSYADTDKAVLPTEPQHLEAPVEMEHLSPPPLPSSAEMTDSYQQSFVRMLLSLGGLLVLVFGTFWVLKRLGKGKFKLGSHRVINIIEKRPLSPKTVLYILEVEGKRVLVSESQLEVRTLSVLDQVINEE